MKTRIASFVSMLLIGLVATASFAAAPKDGAARAQKYWQRIVTKLSLTTEQQSQLQPVFQARAQQTKSNRESFKSQFQSVLTADQQARLEQIKSEAKTARQNHQKFDRRNAMKSLNLTDAQKSQLKTLHQQGMSQMKEQKQQFVAQVEAVLNPTQKATFEQMMSRHHGPRGHKPQQAPKSEQE